MDEIFDVIEALTDLGSEVGLDDLDAVFDYDFFTLSPEDFEQLSNLAEAEETQGLFAGLVAKYAPDGQIDSTEEMSDFGNEETVTEKAGEHCRKEVENLGKAQLFEILEQKLSPPQKVPIPGGDDGGPIGFDFQFDGSDDLASEDLFQVTDEKRVSQVRCECGEVYPFLISPLCPKCGGNDPLSYAWANHRSTIRHNFDKQVVESCCQTPLGLFSVLDRVQKGLESVLGKSNDESRLGDLTDLYEDELADRMIKFFDPLFDTSYFNSEHLDEIKQAAGNEAFLVTQKLVYSADYFRDKLGVVHQQAAWIPNREFEETLSRGLNTIWSPSLKQLGGRLKDSFIVAAASYQPVRDTWEKQRKEEHIGVTVAKFAWKGFKAVKTYGISLVFDIGKFLFKSARERERYELFRKHVSNALVECQSLRVEIEEAKKEHRLMLSALGSKLSMHLLFSLADHYSVAPLEKKMRITEGVARVSGVKGWQDGNYKETGIAAMERRAEEARLEEERKQEEVARERRGKKRREVLLTLAILLVFAFISGIAIVAVWHPEKIPAQISKLFQREP